MHEYLPSHNYFPIAFVILHFLGPENAFEKKQIVEKRHAGTTNMRFCLGLKKFENLQNCRKLDYGRLCWLKRLRIIPVEFVDEASA